jgi:probable addiction module antidote protein
MSDKTTVKLKEYDVIDFLESDADIAGYVIAAASENDPAALISAINDAARAYGINKLAKQIGVNREVFINHLTALLCLVLIPFAKP